MTLDRRMVLQLGATAALATAAGSVAAAEGDTADFLFVQSADTMRYDAETKRLTLVDVSPVTIMFSDRPDRIAANMKTAKFVPFWSEGTDSFLTDPPNANLSVLENDGETEIVVTLRNPVLEGGELSYDVTVLEGEMPTEGTAVSLFIDVIGMPLTPLSYAGVRRRAYRRAVLR